MPTGKVLSRTGTKDISAPNLKKTVLILKMTINSKTETVNGPANTPTDTAARAIHKCLTLGKSPVDFWRTPAVIAANSRFIKNARATPTLKSS